MKKTISIILTFVMLFGTAFIAKATTKDNRIYSETISAKKNETFEIPVKIDNNTGIMGFGIDVTYDSNVINPVSVEGSELLNGMLNDSIETSEAGSFRVLYTGSENFCSDGTIFTLTFNASEDATGNVSVTLSYTTDDTFNESFSEVVLNCETISISFDNGTSDPTNPSDPTDPTDPTEPDPSEEDLKLSVRIKNWAAGLDSPWNTIMSIIVAPVVFVLQIFGR